jgi:Family of unknown function (DUF6152)
MISRRVSLRGIAAGALALALAGNCQAHHSAAAYDASRCLAARGTVSAFKFMSPHSLLWLAMVDASGRPMRLGLEGVSSAQLRAYDARWTRDLLKKGEVVTAEFSPRRDGRTGGLLQDVTLPSGAVINAWRPATCPGAVAYAASHSPPGH